MLKTHLISFDQSDNTGAIDVKMHRCLLEEKSSFKRLGLTIFYKLDWGSCIISTAKTASKKIGALICSMKFLTPEVALYLYKYTIQTCTNCCHVWAGALSCYLELSDKLQKQICRTVDPSLAASLEPLAHCQNVASLSILYKYYFGRSSSELAQLVLLKDVNVNSFFLRTARLWKSLPIECFPLAYDINCFKSRTNRHLLTAGSF